jgi:hypothetical protein
MASVFDIGTIGIDESDETVIEFTEEFMELTVEERLDAMNNVIDYVLSLIEEVEDIDLLEIDGEDEDEEDAETESDDDDDDAFDPLQLS